ncbi:pilus assembly protein TadE [Massilia sp. R2A-15]|uniref:pilus assembly protein TadE n=1 Tax=Massilia sp. R2A-15 TaxID=3064278 RepID=UPI0027330E17|nr:pilus assembly protein TadE [Massilia sp. R2A-15]WLI91405.1 pilus assembly protein TadE [Massilia sp. R2A-15]
MFIPLLFVLLGFCALAIDLGMIYNRKAELNGIAKSVALAAARELNGTQAGVTAALTKADAAARRLTYQYGSPMIWNEAAITFGTSPSPTGDWIDATTAKSTPAGRYYAKVDTSALDPAVGTVDTFFIQILSDYTATSAISDRAVAGRGSVNVTPLAICAMSPVPRGARTNPGPPITVELVEFGFRRGVNYDLMQLNPNATTPANFVVDPVFPPGATGASTHTSAAAVGPFVCTGTMWMPRVTGGSIRVSGPFPLSDLYRQLNSRFDQYENNLCKANGSPPDFNVKIYEAATAVSWMSPAPTAQVADPSTTGARLQTVLDLPAPPGGAKFGPLWSYARAAKYAATEPPAGDATFLVSDWTSLYGASPTASGYPTGATNTPYLMTSGSNYGVPGATHLAISKENRRVLNVPLLSCPIATGDGVSADVLAVGKFFMTIPATATSVYAEFGGIIPEKSLSGPVELYP